MRKFLLASAAIGLVLGFGTGRAAAHDAFFYEDANNDITMALVRDDLADDFMTASGGLIDPKVKQGTVLLCNNKDHHAVDALTVGAQANGDVMVSEKSDPPNVCHNPLAPNEVDISTCTNGICELGPLFNATKVEVRVTGFAKVVGEVQ